MVAQHMYSLPAYAFIAQDFTTQAALYTHHQYIAGFIMTGAFALGAIFFIRDYNPEQNEDNVLARMLCLKKTTQPLIDIPDAQPDYSGLPDNTTYQFATDSGTPFYVVQPSTPGPRTSSGTSDIFRVLGHLQGPRTSSGTLDSIRDLKASSGTLRLPQGP
ncbi:photosystem I P700 apoprotein A2, plastid [Artemisia annua]|uniref:Photosystem I P700 apoprotein A2, plastid n=1 Tax=Artemisia annua TaxID=35608 RepID=A0A2U1NT84_ARTAN|nr:photosystem I P700 apoprotein A2, plastid [Artemisia annua]